jgi:hypothetical protein
MVSSTQRADDCGGNSSLLRLTKALGISPHDLVERPPGRQTALVHRTGRRLYGLVGAEFLELLVPSLHRTIVVTRAVVPPGWSNRDSPFEPYIDDSLLHVLAGRLIFCVQEPVLLTEGDTLTRAAGLPFRGWWDNPYSEPAEVISVVMPEGMR